MTDEELKGLFELVRQENAAAHAETRRQLREENAAAHAETRREMREENAAAHEETRRYIDQKVAENRDFFQVLNEGTRHDIGLVAEKVVRLDEKLDSVKIELEERMERGFADTKAMIKFSHAELDRRMSTLEESQRTLEESVSDLLARVERLEGSTH